MRGDRNVLRQQDGRLVLPTRLSSRFRQRRPSNGDQTLCFSTKFTTREDMTYWQVAPLSDGERNIGRSLIRWPRKMTDYYGIVFGCSRDLIIQRKKPSDLPMLEKQDHRLRAGDRAHQHCCSVFVDKPKHTVCV